MKYDLIVADPPFQFQDSLKMSDVKRSSSSQYKVLKTKDIINLDVKSIAADNSVLALWVPSAMLSDGLETMNAWGFQQKQTWIWVKTKVDPLYPLVKRFRKGLYNYQRLSFKTTINIVKEIVEDFDLNSILNFNLGRTFRQTHELCLIGTRGKVSKLLKNKSQRSVFVGPALPIHSEKPEELQDRLEKMYPGVKSLEMFSRRLRPGWTCVGLELPGPNKGEDIRDSIKRLQKKK